MLSVFSAAFIVLLHGLFLLFTRRS